MRLNKRKKNLNKMDIIFRIINVSFLILYAFAILYPLLNLLSISLSDTYSVMRGEISFFPKGINFRAYERMIGNERIWRSYLNTLFVAAFGVVFGLLITSFAAYSIAKKKLPGVGIVSFLFAAVLWLDVGIIPGFMVVLNLKLYDKLATLIIVALFNPFYIFIMRGFFENIPSEIEESAIVDGANHISILFKIILPVSKPILATVGLWIAVGHWNAFLQPLMYLRTQEKYTLQMILREIVLEATAEETSMDIYTRNTPAIDSVKYAAVVVSTVPIMLLYPFLQKYFVKGAMVGSVKG